MLKRLLRNTLERSPAIMSALRTARDELQWRSAKSSEIPEGFLFANSPGMQIGFGDQEETVLFMELFPEYDVLVDIGANTGFYSLLALKHGKHVIAIEPLHENVRMLCRNLRENQWTAEVWPIGLDQQPGVAVLYGGGTGASLAPGWASTPESWKQFIPVNTLDNVIANRFSTERLLIKLDVEGGELGVLRGATSVLDRNAIWVVEITLDCNRKTLNPQFLETFEIFWSRGYKSFSADAQRLPVTRGDVARWINRGSPDFGSVNWLFIPRTIQPPSGR